jgi:glycosyltransferase involved in cell wall biosynthesis
MHIFIIMPAYNVADFIATAIESVLAQTHRDWTLLVIDDGSTDATAEIAARFADPRLRLLRQHNAGVSAARNRGLGALGTESGGAVMFLDADDWLAPDALARLAATLAASPDALAAYGAHCFVTEDGRTRSANKPGPFPEGDILERLLVQNQFANGGHVLIREAAVRRLVGFRSDLRYGEDWEFWCRLAALGRFAAVPGGAPLLFVRQRANGAVLRLAGNPRTFRPCMEAVFGNPELIARLGAPRVAALRRQAEAENRWIIGRELIRHGRRSEGLGWLRRSVLRRPRPHRLLLLAAAHALPLVPPSLRGPFRRYRTGLTQMAGQVN